MLKFLFGAGRVAPVRPKPIIICSTMRSGSTMVCEDMRNTGSLGLAKEFYKDWRPGKTDHPERMAKLAQTEVSANGVFSAKVMSKYLPFLEDCLLAGRQPATSDKLFPEVAAAFKDAVWVYLKREDIVGQAISRHISTVTGVFHNFEDGRHKKSAAILERKGTKAYNDNVKYNYGLINRAVSNIAREQAIWELFFQSNAISPLRITYEECAKDTTYGYLENIANLAGVTLESKPAGARTIKKLSNDRNRQFHRQYIADLSAKIKEGSFSKPGLPQATRPEKIQHTA